MANWFKVILDLLYPPKCEACGKNSTEALCVECFRSIKFMKPQLGIHAVSTYDGILKTAIHKFKFNKKKHLAEPLGILMAKYLGYIPNLNMQEIDSIVPVPLHIKRLRQRSFNQSELLAKVLQRYYKIRIATNVLERIRDTKPQFDLHPNDRKVNVAGAFRVSFPQEVHNKNILLLDDIYTTGSTIAECSKVLKLAGAKKVEVLTLSRAVEI